MESGLKKNRESTECGGMNTLDELITSRNMGKPWASIVSIVQAPVQCYFRPAVWLPFIKNLHSRQEKWKFESDSYSNNLESVLRALMIVIKEDKSRAYWDIQTITSAFLQVYVYTRAEWLDIIEIRFENNTAEVWSFSSGFLPLFIPFACFMNLPLFWVPFLDWGVNRRRLDKVVAALQRIDAPVERHS